MRHPTKVRRFDGVALSRFHGTVKCSDCHRRAVDVRESNDMNRLNDVVADNANDGEDCPRLEIIVDDALPPHSAADIAIRLLPC